MSVISVSNSKGGAGKTTLAMILADQLVENGLSVAVIDADPNGIITKWAAKRAEAGRELPYSVTSQPKEAAMIETIAQLANENDMVIIDLEGTASRMMSRALIRSHLVLVPFNQSPVDAELAAAAVSLIQEEEEAVERKIRSGWYEAATAPPSPRRRRSASPARSSKPVCRCFRSAWSSVRRTATFMNSVFG
jgi:chromosome partitioning protein